jgi:hypothetical protein
MTAIVRYLGFAVLIGAAVYVYVAMAPAVVRDVPTLPSFTQYESLISTALADDAANNLRTEGAPQQQVVNGWTARDLLTIIAKEQADLLKAQGAVVDATGNLTTQPFDDRVPALLLIGVLAVCWAGLSAQRPEVVASSASASTPIPN